MLGSLVASMIINFKIGLIFLIMIILISIVLYFIVKASSTKYTKVQSKLDDLSIVSSENLKGSREVRGFATQEKKKNVLSKKQKLIKKKLFDC